MKNLKNVAILLVMFAIISCGNSIESNAQKLVKLQCKAQKLAKKAMSGDIDQIEASNLAMEAAKFGEKVKNKYKSKEEQEKFQEAMIKYAKECK